MKIVGKILVYLMVLAANAAVYLVVFSMAMGLNFTQSKKLIGVSVVELKAKIEDTAKKKEQADAQKKEFEKEKSLVQAEREELKQQKQQFNKEKEELVTLKNQIEELLGAKTAAKENKMYSLAKIFDGMDKERVAQVFTEMNDSLIITILPKMKPANASLVLQYMEPMRSAQISRMILGGS